MHIIAEYIKHFLFFFYFIFINNSKYCEAIEPRATKDEHSYSIFLF